MRGSSLGGPKLKKFNGAEDPDSHVGADVSERLVARDAEIRFEGGGAFDELVVRGVSANDLEPGSFRREEDVNPPSEQRQEFLELRLFGKSESPEDFDIFLDDRGSQTEANFAGFPEVDDAPGVASIKRGNEDVGIEDDLHPRLNLVSASARLTAAGRAPRAVSLTPIRSQRPSI